MLMLKNRRASELSEANSHAKYSHAKQLLKNIHPLMLASFCSVSKTYLPRLHRKIYRMSDCTHIRQLRRKTSRQNACTVHITISVQ